MIKTYTSIHKYILKYTKEDKTSEMVETLKPVVWVASRHQTAGTCNLLQQTS